jgi:hypothetical protein
VTIFRNGTVTGFLERVLTRLTGLLAPRAVARQDDDMFTTAVADHAKAIDEVLKKLIRGAEANDKQEK